MSKVWSRTSTPILNILYIFLLTGYLKTTCLSEGPVCTERVWSLHMPGWLHGDHEGQYPLPWATVVAKLKPTRKKAWNMYSWPIIIGFSHFPKCISQEQSFHWKFFIAWGTGTVTLFTCSCHIIRCLRRQVVECFSGELSDHTSKHI